MKAKYTTNKQILPESPVSEIREAFKRAEPDLALEIRNSREGETKVRNNIQDLTAFA